MYNDFKKHISIFSLYFKTSWGGNIMTLLFRLITQIFTKSEYEHVANVIRCPQCYGNCIYKDGTKSVKVQAGSLYVFEATKSQGFIITPIDDRLLNPGNDKSLWTGTIFIQEPIDNQNDSNIQIAWEDATNLLGERYQVVPAVLSAFDQFRIIKAIRNFCVLQKRLTAGSFCSMFSLINWCKYLNISIDKEMASRFTPEEVCNFLTKKKICFNPKLLRKFVNGELVASIDN
jgi:hypothetical protein